ncbi:MAG: hypothetical protein AB1792_03095 [Candidatus Zixiibacteriota bacterium]
MVPSRSRSKIGSPPKIRASASASTHDHLIIAVGVIVALVLFAWQARMLWFTQDDAYISYRYARNALAGYGLVFNPWERVEGYTNFLWVIWLVLAGLLRVDLDLAAKVLGVLSGGGMIVLSALLGRAVWRAVSPGSRFAPWAGVFGAVLLAANGSLAYWTVSGLETAFFGFWITLSLWLWLRRSPLVIATLALAAMTRPEGMLIWIVLVLGEWWIGDGPRTAARLFGAVVLLLTPFALFKLLYYGSLLPNPFYAKTGLAWEYFQSGLAYAWAFLSQYGLWGVSLLLVVAASIILRGRWRIVPLLWLVFAVYVVGVGGDVLRPNRFFVPLLVPFVIASLGAVAWGIGRIAKKTRGYGIAALGLAGWCFLSWYLPRSLLDSTRALELGLTTKMTTVAGKLRATDPRPFTLAASTIGKIGYELPGHRIIDMLGLVDSTVARHPESIPGNVSSWKERNFNATYVLSQDPDYILFSTGHKPSAPAERALILHEKFRRDYYTILFPIPGRSLAVHKRRGGYAGGDSVWPSIEPAQLLNAAYNYIAGRQEADSAILAMQKLKALGIHDYSVPDAFIAERHYDAGRLEVALAYADSALAIDSMSISALLVRGAALHQLGDTVAAEVAWNRIRRLAPWLAPGP